MKYCETSSGDEKNDDAAQNKNGPSPAVETETEALFHSRRRDEA